MKTFIRKGILAVLLCFATDSLTGQNTWSQKGNFTGGARFDAVAFTVGNKVYVGSGDKSGVEQKDLWEFDPVTDTWAKKADFPGGAKIGAVAFTIGTKAYFGTGFDPGKIMSGQSWTSGYTKDFWEYDPQTNTWTKKADFPGTARVDAVGFSIGTKGYIGTGSDASGVTKDFYEYDPVTNTWARKADFAGAARNTAIGFSLGNKGYLGTGHLGNYVVVKDFYEYDPITNIWTRKADFGGAARTVAVAFTLNNKGYVGTGSDLWTTQFKDFYEYDPSSNTWSKKADMGSGVRSAGIAFAVGGKGYVGTGYISTIPLGDLWEYSPALTTGLNGNINQSDMNIFPNPFIGTITIELYELSSETEVSVFSLSGQLIQHKNYAQVNKLQVETTDLASGIYFIHIKTGNRSCVRKLIKE